MCTDSSKGDIDLPTGKVAQFKLVTQTGLQQILQIVIFLLIYDNYILVETHSSHELYTVPISVTKLWTKYSLPEQHSTLLNCFPPL